LLYLSPAYSQVDCGAHNSPICTKQKFASIDLVKDYYNNKYGGSDWSYIQSCSSSLSNGIDLDGDAINEDILCGHEGNPTRFIIVKSTSEGYRVIGNIVATQLSVDKLPKMIATRLGLSVEKFNNFKYIKVGHTRSAASASRVYYAFNGLNYNQIGSWSYDDEATFIKH